MEKLKKVVEQYGRWSELYVYIIRIETHMESDFSHSLENAKALLEAIGKEICTAKGHELSSTSSVNGVLKNAFQALGFSNSTLVNQVSSALATIGQQVGELRNDIGLTAHGKSLNEIRERNEKVDLLTREFLVDTIDIVSCFLIRNFENVSPRVISDLEEFSVVYEEEEEFNDYWDDAFGDFQMGTYSYIASEILFNVDKQAYIDELKIYETEGPPEP